MYGSQSIFHGNEVYTILRALEEEQITRNTLP